MDITARRLHVERLARESPVIRGWSEIAAWLKCSIDTARDYGRKHAMPVHKQRGARHNDQVIAYRDELTEWMKRFTDRTPFDTDPNAAALPDRQLVMRYRLETDRAVLRLQRLRRALKQGRMQPAGAIVELDAALRILTIARTKFATGRY